MENVIQQVSAGKSDGLWLLDLEKAEDSAAADIVAGVR
jgi:hypothetical protein